MNVEEWRPVPGWWGYSVSSHGRVRSDDRVVVRRNGRSLPVVERILRVDPLGRVTFAREGTQHRFYASELFTEVFGTAAVPA
ncbi:NUMOD4 domain-containing protein [Mycobacterium sp. ITM-2016-00318]|uniref:NUMOD4 domain-containing protein n=1 Tax=Mycobacterium sp. ITM-2016-00318 TaxID=2099693 RepID=UPI00130492A7